MASNRLEAARLAAHPLLAGAEVHPELASTNDHALRRLSTDAPALPYLIAAEAQTSGRGRGANRWWSDVGALTFSLMMDRRQQFVREDRFTPLSLLTGWAISRALAQLSSGHVRLKWPNDVFLNGKKVCGILIESSPRDPKPLVVGIGLNVNNSLAHASDEVRDVATSLCDEEARSWDRSLLLEAILDSLQQGLEDSARDGFSLADEWSSRCLLEGRTVRVSTGKQETIGICQGIDNEGALLLRVDGLVTRCYAGTVTML